jgi:hypothetical protein
MSFGKPCPVSDLFGVSGRALLHRLALPEPWAKNIEVALGLIDDLDEQTLSTVSRDSACRKRSAL